MWRPGELAEQFASHILATALTVDHGGIPPVVDVHLVAKRFGLAVLPTEIEQDGRLRLDGEQAIVCVRTGLPWVRERFTVAHEIVHWALRSPIFNSSLTSEIGSAFHSEETLCDTVAGAMLLPAAPIRRRLDWARPERRHNLVALFEVAAQTQVSLGTAAVRMRDLFGWRRTLLHFVRRDGGFFLEAEAGVYPWEEGRLSPTHETLWELDRIRGEGRETRHLSALPLCIDGRGASVPADVQVRYERAIVLVHLPRDAGRRSLNKSCSA